MLRVGLTGGIGAGKSTVATRLSEHGAVVIDADLIAREVVEPGTPALAEIVAEFGAEVLDEHGALNRPALAAKAFADELARARLNAIVHPRVGARTTELLAGARADAVVVHDIPLLVENGLAPGFHLVLVVDAPEEVRVHRLVHERGMAEADARARIAAQAGEAQRRAVADVWLDNSGARDAVQAEVDALWADRLVPFEANVRLHRGATDGTPRLLAYDPEWPTRAQRLIARVRLAAGERALRVDHIGSTAVEGLPAKDVLDLQLTVRTLDDAEAVAGALNDAGFPGHSDLGHERPGSSAPGVNERRERLHRSADPGRPAHVHVRAADSDGWRPALLLRDWLRAEPRAREEYAATKKRLADQFDSEQNAQRYADAKRPWFEQAHLRAREWAERTGWTP